MDFLIKEVAQKILYNSKSIGIAKHLTHEQFAETLGVSSTHIKHIESERRKPSMDLLFRICVTLNLSLDELIFPQKVKVNPKRNQIDRLLEYCNEKQLHIIYATLVAMLEDTNSRENL